MKSIILIILLVIIYSSGISASSYSEAYPYTQKCINCDVLIKSYPFNPYYGPFAKGETKIFKEKKFLYKINEYFSSSVIFSPDGNFLVAINDELLSFNNSYNIIRIYKKGNLIKNIPLNDLIVNTEDIPIEYGRIKWVNDKKNQQFGIYNDTLFVITYNNILYKISLNNGRILKNIKIDTTYINQSLDFSEQFRKKYKKVKYPPKFILPDFVNGNNIEKGVKKWFSQKEIKNNYIEIKLYVTLKIKNTGESNYCHISSRNFYDKTILKALEQWLLDQTYQTKLIPKNFDEFEFTDFIYIAPAHSTEK